MAVRKGKNREGSFTLPLLTDRAGYATVAKHMLHVVRHGNVRGTIKNTPGVHFWISYSSAVFNEFLFMFRKLPFVWTGTE